MNDMAKGLIYFICAYVIAGIWLFNLPESSTKVSLIFAGYFFPLKIIFTVLANPVYWIAITAFIIWNKKCTHHIEQRMK